MNEILAVDRGDVEVIELNEWCPECEINGVAGGMTHAVRLDVREIGSATYMFRGCQTHCEDYAKRLQSALPAAS